MRAPDVTVSSTHLAAPDLARRLATSKVVPAALLPPPPDGAYDPGALVPSTAWRPLTAVEFEEITANADDPPPPYFAHLVLTLPDPAFVSALEAVAEEQAAILHENSLRTSTPDLRARMDALLSRDRVLQAFGPALSACHANSGAGFNTLTPNPDGSLSGMHVDSWDRRSLADRRRASNRLTVNVGTRSRYLLFVPRQVAGITEDMGRTSEEGWDVSRAFLVQSGERRVYRLELKPGEAYIAPTENLIHDGSNLGSAEPDRALMMRGFIQPRAQPATVE